MPGHFWLVISTCVGAVGAVGGRGAVGILVPGVPGLYPSTGPGGRTGRVLGRRGSHSHTDALQRSCGWVPVRSGSLPAIAVRCQEPHQLGGKPQRALLGPAARPDTAQCPQHLLLSLGHTELVRHFLRTNTPRPQQETQVPSVALKEVFPPPSCPRTRFSPNGKGVFCVASCYRMNSCSLERVAARCSPGTAGIGPSRSPLLA